MTDKAPERLWAWEYKGHTPWGPIKPDLDVVTNGAEYIRADIHQALEAERDEAKMQSLADLGQAQDALEAQKNAEAENVKLRDAMARACDLIDDVAEGKTGMGTPYRVLAAALQETEK